VKHKFILSLSILFILNFVFACKGILRKECKENFATDQGIIIRKINDGCYPSLNFPEKLEKTWIVTSKSQWDSIWTDYDKKYTTTCDTPKVDFTTESVLAFYHGSGHGIKNIRSVSRDDGAKTIKYKILDIDCNKTRSRTMEFMVSYHLVVIPKIPEGYNVIFELSEGN
jgi:hypothetical protein